MWILNILYCNLWMGLCRVKDVILWYHHFLVKVMELRAEGKKLVLLLFAAIEFHSDIVNDDQVKHPLSSYCLFRSIFAGQCIFWGVGITIFLLLQKLILTWALSKRMPEQVIRKIAITSSCVLHRRIVFCGLFLAKVPELRTDNKWSVGYFCCEKNVTAIELVYRML